MLDLRRLLAALLIAAAGVVVTQVPAHACKCVSTSVRQDADRADAVFRGTLESVGTARSDGRRVTSYRVTADRLYKGDLATPRVVVTSAQNSCGLQELPTDESYVWFVVEKGGELTSDQCRGTAPATDERVQKVERALGAGTALGPRPDREVEHAEFTQVAGAEPETLTRLAAPGAALVLVGLLGLFVIRRRTARD